jgi:hypothetical protein
VAGIAATITSQGLKCTAVRDDGSYPGKVKVSDARMRWLEQRVIVRHGPHRDWNYTIVPVPRSVPEPEPERPGRVPAAVLNHPAFTGMTTGDVNTLVTALEIPFGAHREQRNYTVRARRGGTGARVRAVSNGGGPNASTKLALTDYVLAGRLRSHLSLPMEAIAVLLGADRSTISHAITLTDRLIAGSRIPLPAAAPPPGNLPRTPAELLRYTAAAGITLTLPQNGQSMPERFRTRRSSTPTRPKPKTY